MAVGRGEGRNGASRRADLACRGLALLASVSPAPTDAGGAPASSTDLQAVDGKLAVLAARLRDQLRHCDGEAGKVLADVSSTLAEVHSVRYDIAQFTVQERLGRLEALNLCLAELRRAKNPEELLDRVCEAVVTHCGFDRAMLSRVTESAWQPWKSYARGSGTSGRAFREWLAAIPEIELDSTVLESEVLRRLEPAIVTDAANDPRVYGPLIEASGLRSYVVAPLMPTGRGIGLLHADYENGQVVPLDRDILWAFAKGFGQVFERAVLLSRLHDQRSQVVNAFQNDVSVLDELADTEIDLAAADHPTALTAARQTRSPAGVPAAELGAVLTARELEVLSLMATGATNRRIAERLVITDGTVKSHVKRILRKLAANNRSEAVARYLHLTIGRAD